MDQIKEWIVNLPISLQNLTAEGTCEFKRAFLLSPIFNFVFNSHFQDLTYILKTVPIWVYGTAGLFLLLKLYMDQKWTHWQKTGLKGPAPSLMAWGNGGLFMEMLANKTDPFEYVEKYGNVSGKARDNF